MAWSIDKSKCMGCGICASVCPEGIEMVEGKASVKKQDAECISKAASVCPVKIIVND